MRLYCHLLGLGVLSTKFGSSEKVHIWKSSSGPPWPNQVLSMVLGVCPRWSWWVPSKKFKIHDPPFFECRLIQNFDSQVVVVIVHLVNFLCWMGRGDHPKTFFLLALFCQSTPSLLIVEGGWWWVGGPWDVRLSDYTFISWDWGYLSIPISHPHPNSQSLDNLFYLFFQKMMKYVFQKNGQAWVQSPYFCTLAVNKMDTRTRLYCSVQCLYKQVFYFPSP